MAEKAANSARDAISTPVTSPTPAASRDLDAAWRLAYVVSGEEQTATAATTQAFAEVASPPGGPAPSRSDLLAATLRRSLSQAAETRPVGPVVAPGLAVTSALWELPADQRAALWLTEVDDLSDAELATVLGLTAGSVHKVAKRAARWLDVALDHKSGPLCQHEPKLADYLDGNLPLVEAAEIDDHLNGCPTCTSKVHAYEELADLPAVLDQAVPKAPTTLFSLATATGEAASPPSRTQKRVGAPPALRPLAACCAGLLALGLIGVGIVRPSKASSQPNKTTDAPTSVVVRLPGLSDGNLGSGVTASPTPSAPSTTSTTAQPVTFPTLPAGGTRTTTRR